MNKSKKKKKNEKYLSVMSSQPGSYKIWVLAVTVLDYVDKTLAFGLLEEALHREAFKKSLGEWLTDGWLLQKVQLPSREASNDGVKLPQFTDVADELCLSVNTTWKSSQI